MTRVFTNQTRKRLRTLTLLFLLFSAGPMAMTAFSAEAPVRIKLATLAPRGTSLQKVLQELVEKWRQAPSGGVEVVIYPDGVMGGEAEMVRRMRVGQIQAALLSVQGLSEIDPSVTALSNLPMMFRSLDEVEFIREKLRPAIEKRLLDKGFVALLWGDVGWVRFFSKEEALHPDQFKKMKLFAWAGSNEQIELMKAIGLQPVPLETNDILTGLQTGLINAIPTAPLIALAGQFYGPAPHMLELNYAPLVGSVVITRKAWESIPSTAREALMKAADEIGKQLTTRNRAESDEAVEAMKKRGLKVHAVSPEVEAEWRKLALEVYPRLRGGIVPAEMFDEVERRLRDYRAAPGGVK